jgi:hypothetical protein
MKRSLTQIACATGEVDEATATASSGTGAAGSTRSVSSVTAAKH